LAATLRAGRLYAGSLSAIVSVADDGGSSGRLRHCFDILPPGDLRKCLVAMGDPDSLWARAFEHRFEAGELEGHSLGNLLIAGLAAAAGDVLVALEEAGRLVGAVGRVYPATTVPVVLKAEAEGRQVEGQVAVASTRQIARVSVVPADPEPPEAALAELAAADQVVVGPGSLFTSVLAVAAIPALREALAASPGQKVYVCNLAPQVPETSGFDVSDHVEALLAHGLDVDVVLCDTARLPLGSPRRPWVERALAGPSGRAHDPGRLAQALQDLLA